VSIISAYILRQMLAPLLVTIAIALLVLLTERMLRLLDLVLDSQGGLTVLLQMLAYLVPHYVGLALPAAFFLGILLAFNRLHQNRELDALGSAGVGIRRLVMPVLAFATGLMALTAANFAIGQPYARYIYRALVYEVTEVAANVYLQPGTFMEVEGVTFMAERISRSAGEFGEVFIYRDNTDGASTAITADRGSLDIASAGDRSTLVLRDGVQLETRADEAGTPRDARVLRFDRLQTAIDLAERGAFRPRGEDERELTLWELWRGRASPPPGVTTDQMLAEFHDRLVRTLSVLLLPFLAIPFALGPRRARNAFGMAAGILILVAYNQLLSIGKSLSSLDTVSPLVGQWLPLAALALGSGYLFYRSARMVPRSGSVLTWPAAALEGLVRLLRPLAKVAARQRPE
jgi:lipopolysaccharide export system permease protein